MIESPDIIERLKSLVESGGSVFQLFDRTLVPRTRALELIEVLLESLPEEIEQAKELLEKKEQFLEEARQQAGEIVDEAVRRAERLVDADQITTEARKRADTIRVESDAYVTERLLQLEQELTRLLEEVRAGIRATGRSPGRKGSVKDDTGFTLDKL